MLNKNIQQFISEKMDQYKADGKPIELFKEEFDYAKKHSLIEENTSVIEIESKSRFSSAYIERSNKETEEFLGEEGSTFLDVKIDYLKKNINEFIYIESNWLELIGVDALSFEVDNVFGTYDVMLGLKRQKKFESYIKSYLVEKLQGEDSKFDLMFSNEDGLWNLNFDFNSVEGFREDLTISEALNLIYSFLFHLVEAVEQSK